MLKFGKCEVENGERGRLVQAELTTAKYDSDREMAKCNDLWPI